MGLDAFEDRQLQNCLALLTVLEDEGVREIAEARLRITEQLRLERPRVRRHVATGRCPECGGQVVEKQVNDHPSTMVGGGYTAVRICRRCLHEEWL